MDKEFETWWTINKFRLMENDDVGVREIALAAYLAGRQTAQPSVQADLPMGFPNNWCHKCKTVHVGECADTTASR